MHHGVIEIAHGIVVIRGHFLCYVGFCSGSVGIKTFKDFDGAEATEGVIGVTCIGDGIIAGGVRAGPRANLLAQIVVGIVEDA